MNTGWMVYANHSGRSVDLFLPQEPQKFQEEADDIDVEDGGPQHVVVQLQLLILPSHDELGVVDDVDAIHQREEAGDDHLDQGAPQEEGVDEGDAEDDPDCRTHQAYNMEEKSTSQIAPEPGVV